MSAPILSVDPLHPNPRQVQRTVDVLRRGGLVVYPTDTYYGIGCDLFSRKAVERLYQVKGRDPKKPFSFLCPDLSDVSRFGHVTNFAYRVMRQLTPGAFTFVLKANRIVPEMMMTKQKQVGIRVPDAPLARALAAELGNPLVTTSATDRDGEPLVDSRDIKDALGEWVEVILDGGIHPNEPSTIVSLIDDQIEVLRQGKGLIEGL